MPQSLEPEVWGVTLPLSPLARKTGKISLKPSMSLRDGYNVDIGFSIVQEIVAVFPRSVDAVDHVSSDSALHGLDPLVPVRAPRH